MVDSSISNPWKAVDGEEGGHRGKLLVNTYVRSEVRRPKPSAGAAVLPVKPWERESFSVLCAFRVAAHGLQQRCFVLLLNLPVSFLLWPLFPRGCLVRTPALFSKWSMALQHDVIVISYISRDSFQIRSQYGPLGVRLSICLLSGGCIVQLIRGPRYFSSLLYLGLYIVSSGRNVSITALVSSIIRLLLVLK